MKFEVTNDNLPFLNARGKVILKACPGSGKTSAIAYKLDQLSQECKDKYGLYAGVAVLSFTNVAKDEIAEKFSAINNRHFGYPNLISTIDSFINQFITLPFYYLSGKAAKRPEIMDTVLFLDKRPFESLKDKNGERLFWKYKPSELRTEMNGSYSWKGIHPKEEAVDPAIFKSYAGIYKKWQFDKGYLNNDDSTYAACQLLQRFPEIAKSLIQRFPYILVDESQDTSEIQYRIFDLLIAAGLKNLEFIGDPYQSLYEFRNARPELFMERFRDRENWIAITFRNCRRSSQQIINTYSRLHDLTEVPVISISGHPTDHKIKVILYDEEQPGELLDSYYNLVDSKKNNIILVRGDTHLELFGAKYEPVNPWKNGLCLMLITATEHLKENRLKACIDLLRKFYVEISIPEGDYAEKRQRYTELITDVDMNARLSVFSRLIPDTDEGISVWDGLVSRCIQDFFDIVVDLELKKNKGKAYYDQNLKALFTRSESTQYPVSTIHRVKGKTFSSVLLVLSSTENSKTLTLSDFRLSPDNLTESQRLIYVAMSRPESLCCIAVPEKTPITDIVAGLGVDFELV